MTTTLYKVLSAALALAVPVFVFAAAPNNLRDLIQIFIDLINPVVALLSGLALVAFIWGIVKYILSAGDASAKDSGKKIIIGGIIGMFVLFSFWGIVQFLQASIFK